MKNSEKQPKPPQDLSLSAKKRWKALFFEYSISDAAGLQLLDEYARQSQRAEQARATVEKEGTTIRDRFNQVREHPAMSTERGAITIMLSILKQLNLDIEPLRDRPGRPPGK